MRDTNEILTCPVCGREMQKVYIQDVKLNLDICSQGCGGIFFDNREFEKFDEENENIEEILKALENKDFLKVDETIQRTCPACGSLMVKNFASIKQEVEIDCCYVCGGKFLDNNELIKIRAQYNTEKDRSEDFNKYLSAYIKTEMDAVEQERIKGEVNRSGLKRIFDKYFEKIRKKF